MRCLVVALALAGLVTNAFAEEFELPTLRGSNPTYVPGTPSYPRWSGFYGGGTIGYSTSHIDFSKASADLVAFILRNSTLEDNAAPSNWRVLAPLDKTATSYGGFVGYNSQWDNLILGIDLTYNRSQINALAPVSPLTRVNSPGDGFTYTTTVGGSASMQITDYGSIRARAGWITGNMVPYFTAGLALARASYARTATVSGTYVPSDGSNPVPVPFGPWSAADSKSNQILAGWSAGAGVDFAIMPNVFLRGEFEYLSFAPVSGIKAQNIAGRVGAGVRF